MKFRYLIFLFLTLMFQKIGFCQKQASVWYFGDSTGIHFKTAPPTTLHDGAMYTNEGCATISDSLGNLLFYTNGVKVWNRKHKIMLNGSDLGGHPSSTQSAIIVPQPENKTIFYIFTVDWQGRPNGLSYSVVDLAQNSGLGDVTQKNIQLYTPVAEKVTAVKHQNNKDFWVISHAWNSDEFLAYLVTKDGVSSIPVSSKVGLIHTGGIPDGDNENTLGYLKASPNGKFLALAIPVRSIFQLFQFDTKSGAVSAPITIPTNDNFPYGLEFSPDGKKLYLGEDITIHQVDLRTYTQAAIQNSYIEIGNTTNNQGFGALQLGIDGKIYVANKWTHHLGVINNPNLNGKSSNFVEKGIFLNKDSCILGLPTFIQSYFLQNPFQAKSICWNDSTEFINNDIADLDSIKWSFSDQNSNQQNSSKLISPKHKFSNIGKYLITRTIYNRYEIDTTNLEITIFPQPIVDLGFNKIICFGDSVQLPVQSNVALQNLMWQDHSAATQYWAKQNGKYKVLATDIHGCQSADSVQVQELKPPIVKLGPDTAFCSQPVQTITASTLDVSYLWQDGSTNQDIEVKTSGVYTLKVSNFCGESSDHISIQLKDCQPLDLINIFTPNDDGINDYLAFKGIQFSPWEIYIYNRWGTLLYHSENYQNNWNGEKHPDGVYYYILINKDTNQKYYNFFYIKR